MYLVSIVITNSQILHSDYALYYSQVFPNYSLAKPPVDKDSPLARIRKRRVALTNTTINGQSTE